MVKTSVALGFLRRLSVDGYGRTGSGGEWVAGGGLGGENHGGAIALMHIAIHSHGGANLAIALQTPNGYGYIVNHAEAFAVIGESMMESATDVDGDTVGQGLLSSKY